MKDRHSKKTGLQIFERIFAAVAAIMAVVFVANQIAVLSGHSVNYDTVLAQYSTINDTHSAEMYIVRNESVLMNTGGGTVIPVVSEGTKLEKGGELARIFRNVDHATDLEESIALTKELEYYTSIKTDADAYASNIPVYNKNILSAVMAYAAGVDGGDAAAAEKSLTSAREYMTVKQVVLGEEVNVDDQIAAIQARLNALTVESLGSFYTPLTLDRSGYYFASSDGLENSADYYAVKDIDISEVDRLLNLQPTPQPESVVGKTVFSFVWYAVCNLPAQLAGELSVGSGYEVTFPDVSAGTVRMKLEAVNGEEGADTAAAVFSCTYLDRELASLRKCSAQICLHTYTGLLAPKSALRTVDNSTGVFVLLNNVSVFRKVVIIYEDEERILCVPGENDGKGLLKLNDEILTEGVGFEDGKKVPNGFFI